MENWSNIMLAVVLINLAITPTTPNPKKHHARDFFYDAFWHGYMGLGKLEGWLTQRAADWRVQRGLKAKYRNPPQSTNARR